MMRRILWSMGMVLLAIGSWSCQDGTCPAPCQFGVAYCSPKGITFCGLLPGTQCPGWQLQLCAEGQSCVQTSAGVPQCQSRETCKNPYHAKKCVGQAVYWFDDCGRQRELALTCPSGTACVGDTCQLSGGCVSECGPGQARCTDAGWVSNCLPGANACYKWSDPTPCPSGQQCSGGVCQQGPCHDLCPPNATRCQGQSVQVCEKDRSGCARWGAIYKCPSGQRCENNRCTQAKCPASCNITAECAIPDCGSRSACVNGVCAIPPKQCQDKCTLNTTQCSGTQLQACRKEAHGCTDWGPPYPCLSGQICQQGKCVAAPCPSSCSSDADCNIAACGARTKCINGACTAPSQPTCPNPCSSDADCNVAACGARKQCLGQACVVPQQTCPNSCTQDAQCNIPACGQKISCLAGTCNVPQQTCPNSCTQDAQCNISACGQRIACVGGVCATPQQTCPNSCTQDTQCNISACGQRIACVTGACRVPSGGNSWKYGTKVQFINHPKQNSQTKSNWGSVLTDIMQHQIPGQQQLTFTNPVILGHETNHITQNYFRNKFTQADGRKVNAFYVLQDRLIKLNEPNFKVSDVVPFVPKALQASRYNTYLIKQQQHWNDRPLYIMDEWNCYVVDSAIAVDLSSTGKWTYGSADDVKGPLEFLVYGLALAMATEQKDPTYFKNYTQFLEVVAWMGAEGMKNHRAGLTFSHFQGFSQAQYLKDLQTHADAKAMRDFAVRVFGQKWVDNVIFGKP